MIALPDFAIQFSSGLSKEFLNRNIHSFSEAIRFVQNLSYGRNSNKDDLKTVFSDNCATCSTKHALLKTLIDENGVGGIALTLGIYKMNGQNTPKTGGTLIRHGLDYVPEAHVYLKYSGARFDFTHRNSTAAGFEHDLLSEQEINVAQVNLPKIAIHKAFLQQWLDEHPEISYTLDEIWSIREQCIQDLSAR